MPAIGFIYPDGEQITFEDCFSGKLDMLKMGVNLPTLREMAKQRPPDRKPSTTELLKGTLEAFLERTKDYYIDPQKRAFALAGTLHHARLEDSAEQGEESEFSMELFGVTGIADLYDPDTKSLTDYKNTGSYKVSKLLGMSFYLSDDPSGAVYKRSGRWGRAGDPKKVKVFYEDESKRDFGDWLWQLNLYRMMFEAQGKEVEHMYIQATVRDGGLQVSRDRGITRNIYLVEVPRVNDEQVREKFIPKKEALLHALDSGEIPDQCTEEERWGGNKCAHYCDVCKYCPFMGGGE